ncbi:hypothetical protein Efla_000160 [Eimeria flavescens]
MAAAKQCAVGTLFLSSELQAYRCGAIEEAPPSATGVTTPQTDEDEQEIKRTTQDPAVGPDTGGTSSGVPDPVKPKNQSIAGANVDVQQAGSNSPHTAELTTASVATGGQDAALGNQAPDNQPVTTTPPTSVPTPSATAPKPLVPSSPPQQGGTNSPDTAELTTSSVAGGGGDAAPGDQPGTTTALTSVPTPSAPTPSPAGPSESILTTSPPTASIQVTGSVGMCNDISLSARGSSCKTSDLPQRGVVMDAHGNGKKTLRQDAIVQLRCRKNVKPPSLGFSSFLATQQGEELTIPSKTVYQAAVDYLSRSPMAKNVTFTFSVTVTDAKGNSATAEGESTISLALEPPSVSFDSPAEITVKKHESLDFTVTSHYCPHVVTDHDDGIAFQWSVTCPHDPRTADQLLRISGDGKSATLRPYSLTPGYTYSMEVTIRYTTNVSLSASSSMKVKVETEDLYIRFQFVAYEPQNSDESSHGKLPTPILSAEGSGTQVSPS